MGEPFPKNGVGFECMPSVALSPRFPGGRLSCTLEIGLKDGDVPAIPLTSGSEPADGELLERHRRGDPAAFGALAARYAAPLYNLAFRLLGNREDALDLHQEVLLKAYRSIHRFRGDSALRTWFYRIAVNTAKNRARFWSRGKRGPTLSLDAATDPGRALIDRIADPRPSPEGAAYGHEIQARVQQGLDRLPLNQRTVVVLRDVEGLDYREVAALLGISLGTVKSRLARGRDSLRRDLADLLERSPHEVS